MGRSKVKNFQVINAVADDPYITISSFAKSNNKWWKFGNDNLFPQAVALMNRKAVVNRAILKSKAKYIAGKGFAVDDNDLKLADWLKRVNIYGETLRTVTQKTAYDLKAAGNGYQEIVTNSKFQFMNLYHQDATKCRLSKDKKRILLFHNWREPTMEKKYMKEIPIYPHFENTEGDGNLRSIIHHKDYEPEFENYGMPDWIAGLGVSAIAYKTDKWNISRLDNSFNSSGMMIVADEFESKDELNDFKDEVNKKFIGEGKQGKILLLVRKPGADPNNSTRFEKVEQTAEGDWKELHGQSTGDLVIAHQWFRSLTGIADNTGFDTQRILNEYEVALNTVILDEQERFLETYKKLILDILKLDTESLAFINKPPVTAKPPYMKIWEARKADGLDYDEDDDAQQEYLANIGKASFSITKE